jgi:predicted amidohydrolase YtcJ
MVIYPPTDCRPASRLGKAAEPCQREIYWQAGVEVAINTDHMFGVDRDEALNPFNPFLTIYATTTRRTDSGAIISADEAVSRQEALRMMTSTAARFSFDEKPLDEPEQ